MVKARIRPDRGGTRSLTIQDALAALLDRYQESPPRSGRRTPEKEIIRSLAKVESNGSFYVVAQLPWVPWEDLSQRERQVAVLVREGNSDKAIAARLGIRPPTVGVYIRRIYSKLSIRSRVTLGQYGLLETGGSWKPVDP